jgi:hypothetical protein
MMPIKNLVIIFIGTGNYVSFWPQYYESISTYFIPECYKTFFVLTDKISKIKHENNVKLFEVVENFVPTSNSVYEQNNWYNLMYNSIGGLRRFEVIKQLKNDLLSYDWFLFIDADFYCCEQIIHYNEFFNDSKLFFGVQHPTFTNSWKHFNSNTPLPFDRNPESSAYVEFGDEPDNIYIQGCLWGGKIPQIFDLIENLDNQIKFDLGKNILTHAHDESYLNKYRILHNEQFHILPPCYAKPGNILDSEFNYQAKMIHSPFNKQKLLVNTKVLGI